MQNYKRANFSSARMIIGKKIKRKRSIDKKRRKIPLVVAIKIQLASGVESKALN